MTREQAKEHVKNQLENYLQGKGINTSKNFKCLICENGEKTPNMGYKDNRIHCFSCGVDMDIFDLIKHETGRSGKDLFDYCYNYFNLEVGGYVKMPLESHESVQAHKSTTQAKEPLKTQNKDYTDYITQCKTNVAKTDYFTKRGFDQETINFCNLGYDENYTSTSKDGKTTSYGKAVIIPYSQRNNYYIARLLNRPEWFSSNYKKPPAEEAGSEPLYNAQALYNQDNEPVFVVESPFCAISIIQSGARAIAIGGTGHTKLIKQLKAKPTNNPLILSLDNDKAGQEATAKLESELQPINIKSFKINISGEHKDPNEALVADGDLFLQAVKEAVSKAERYMQEIEDAKRAEQAAEREKYIDETSVTAHIENFLGQIKKSVDTPAIPTNFTELDKVLDDGLYEGLYILGAISSLGKTSLILQIADQIAQQGQDVLIFSLEMAKTELMAKSISRITFLESGDNTANAKTTRGITSGKRHAYYNNAEKSLINDSIMKYASYTDHLYIYEGMGDIGAEQIREIAEKHIKITGNKPVIVIDYLQILAPFDPRSTDKQNTDKAVFDLKRLSRDFKLPVIGISSLNRENYNTNISMSAFKESGNIEYSSDVLIGLQFEVMSEDGKKITSEDINILKRKQPRKIELKILKNRNGATGDIITFDYYPMFNYFQETGKKSVRDSLSEPTVATRGKAGHR